MKQRRKAAALKYEMNFEAPVVTAAGMGVIADRIIEKAKDADVPVVYNKELTDFYVMWMLETLFLLNYMKQLQK